MIVFELTMPNKGSWNNKWSGDGRSFLRCRSELGFSKETLKNIVNKDKNTRNELKCKFVGG